MAAVTGGAPKELLPLAGRPLLHWVLIEAAEAGAESAVVVGSPDKPALREAVEARTWPLPVRMAEQRQPRGLAHAVACAEVETDAVVLLPDCVFPDGSPAERMANLVFRGRDGCIAVEKVPDAEVSRYGICEVDETLGAIDRILEKPHPNDTASRWAVAGRYAFGQPFLAHLSDYVERMREEPGEITLTGAIVAAIEQGMDFRAVPLEAHQRRVDCGTPEEYEEARKRR